MKSASEKYGLLPSVLFIVSAAALLRFWHFGQIPYMHDEFSALFRTDYRNFHDLIRYGVLPDSHPAGVQVFLYYWIKLFGTSEWVVKLPFALLGTGSIYLVYRVGERWFGKSTGLFTAAFMSVVQYFIFYSQLARPYAPGLFFTLLSVFYWTKLVFNDTVKKSEVVLFVLASAVNAYIHAFTLFFLLVQLVTGLFFVRGKRLKTYLWSSVAVGLLYAPQLPVFLIQLKRGDIGGWLGAPGPLFLVNFVKYLFQFSTGFFLLTMGIVLYLSFRFYNKGKEQKRFRLIAAAWFLISFLTAYLYSVWRTPVLQYSTLLFVSPFLLLFLFSFIGKMNPKVTGTALLLIMIGGSGVLIMKRQHYKVMYRQGFDQIPKYVIKDLNRYKTGKTAVILHAPNTRMFDFYFEKYGTKPGYFSFDNKTGFGALNRWLGETRPDRIIYGGADYPPLYVIEWLKDKFPYVLEKKSFFNSQFYLLSKKKEENKNIGDERYKTVVKQFGSGGDKPLLLDSGQRFSPVLEIACDTLGLTPLSVLNAAATLSGHAVPEKSLLVFDLRRPGGKALYWSATPLKPFYEKNKTGHYTVHIAKRIQSLGTLPHNTVLKIYIWKKDGTPVYLHRLKFYLTRINPVENGLWAPLTPL